MSEQSENHKQINQRISDFENRINSRLDKLCEQLKPIAETYGTAIRLGKWTKWGLGFVVLISAAWFATKGMFAEFIELFRKR